MMKETGKPITEAAALRRLEAVCAKSEHSAGEMLDKMRQWNLPDEAQARIMETLTKGRFVDDARFAEAFVHDKIAFNGWGRRKIEQALWMKHVDERVYKLVAHDGAYAHLGQQVDARCILAAIDLVQAALVAVPHDERERGARLSMRVEDALELLELLGIDDELDFLHGRFLPWSLPHSKRRTFRQGGAALIEQGGRNAMRRFSSLRVASAEQPCFRCATVWSTF